MSIVANVTPRPRPRGFALAVDSRGHERRGPHVAGILIFCPVWAFLFVFSFLFFFFSSSSVGMLSMSHHDGMLLY